MLREIEQGMIPASVYSDPEIFAFEQERIFARSWMFLAHESEVPEPGDYVVRRIVDDSFIVVRDEQGTVRALFNMCLHRGMQVCRAEVGNASHFRCPYHAWTYKNTGELTGVPFHKDAYGGEENLPRNGTALLSPPHVGSYNGFIFVSLDEHAEPLEAALGDFWFFLDLYSNQSPSGLEVRGPQRWMIDANWKIGAENFAGDTYHTPHTHASVVEIGLFREPKANKRKEGALYFAGAGGGTTYKLPTSDFRQNLLYVGYPEEMVDRMESRWSDAQRALIGEAGFMVSAATVYPNLSFVHNWPQVNEKGLVAPFISIRLWQPVSSTRTEVHSWFAVDREAPEAFKRDSYKAYLMCFGSSGMFEQDDVENWASITRMSRGQMGRRLNLNSRMGLDGRGEMIARPLSQWPAPGVAHVGYGEQNQRAILRRWARELSAERPEVAAKASIGAPPQAAKVA
jgi:phenylpropionate dioxygenase-like ring-hydroxylating dioxygenase large terminal subunit